MCAHNQWDSLFRLSAEDAAAPYEHATAAVYTSDVQFMIPFLHLGPITIPTFGLMVATALLVSAYVLQWDFDRRRAQLERIPGYKGAGDKGQRDEGFLIIGVAGLAGLV